MTNKEAIGQLEWIYQNGFENDLKIVGTDCILDAIREGINALETADKYRWHDLRKDPSDLPNEQLDSETCEYAFILKGSHHVYYGRTVCGAIRLQAYKKLIGWRLHEPFGVVEE